MIRLFAGNIVFVLFLVPLLSWSNILLEHLFNAFNDHQFHVTNLWNINFIELMTNWNWLIVPGLLSLNAILINYTFNQHEFFDRNTYLPSLIYILLSSLFPFSVQLSGELLAQLFSILSINQLLQIKQNDDARRFAFNAAFLMGIAATFNPIYLYFVIILLMVLARIRPFVFREYLLTLIGICLPFLALWLKNPTFFDKLFVYDAHLDFYRLSPWLILLPNILIAGLLILSYRAIQSRMQRSSVRFRRLVTIIFFFLLFVIGFNFLLYSIFETYFYFSIGIFVFSLGLPYAYLDTKKKWIPSLLIYGLVLLNIIKFIL